MRGILAAGAELSSRDMAGKFGGALAYFVLDRYPGLEECDV